MVLSDYIDINDDIEFYINVDSASLFLAVMAKVKTQLLLQFPIGDMNILECWLATIPAPVLDSNGYSIENETLMAFSDALLSLSGTILNVACTACQSTGMQELPNIISSLNDISSIMIDKLSEVLMNALGGEFTQVQLDRMLNTAAQRCPHSTSYIGDSVESALYELPGIDLFGSDSWEMMILAGIALLDTGLVITSMNLKDFVGNVDNALVAQDDLDILVDESSDVTLLDFTEGIVGLLLNETNSFLNKSVMLEDGGLDLGINEAIRSYLLNDDGSLVVSMNDVLYDDGQSRVSIDTARLYGLDTFSQLGVISAIGAQTLHSDFTLSELVVELDVTINMDMSYIASKLLNGTSAFIGGTSYDRSNERRLNISQSERITVKLTLKDLAVSISTLVALDADLIGEMSLSSLMYSDNILQCVLSTLYTNLNTTELSLDIGKVEPFAVDGFSSQTLHDVIMSTNTAIFEQYGDYISKAISSLVNDAGRNMMNDFANDMISADFECPSSIGDTSAQEYVDFRELLLSSEDALAAGGTGTKPYGDVVAKALNLINKELMKADNESGVLRINRYVMLLCIVWHQISIYTKNRLTLI